MPPANAAHSPLPQSNPVPQTLLLDADDTLWENNIYFEKAIASFVEHLNHRHYTRQQVREFLNQVERESIVEHGYGLHSFRKSLLRCFTLLSERPLSPADEREILRFTAAIENHGITLLTGVAETLPALAQRHRLLLVTKGDVAEQTAKVERSGLGKFFSHVEILAEKTAHAYRALVTRHRLDAGRTWMIGNSPRSDINPALEAGLHAVFLAHPQTWALEHEELLPAPAGQQCLRLTSFTDLATVFLPNLE
jgi:putative hydrolase of the HAD superfamily